MPSKSIIVTGVICLGIILSVWIFQKQYTQTTESPQNTSNVVASNDTNVRQTDAELDSDGDGLKDWQEILIGTDPHKADTDGDGTPDGLEIQQGRDPLKKGPNDKNPNVKILLTDNETVAPLDNSVTGQLAKDFFGQYLLLKQGGQDVSDDQINQLVQNTLSSPVYTKATGVQYSVQDLHVTPSNDTTTVQNYKNSLTLSVARATTKNTDSELNILENAVNSQDPSLLNQIDPIIVGYRGFISDMLAMNVPSNAVNLHLALLNSASNILDNIEGIRQTFTDPVKSFAALSQYKEHVAEAGIAVKNLDNYFLILKK